jgi:hypothetical protein
VPVAVSYDSTDNILAPTKGARLNASATPYAGFMGSNPSIFVVKAHGSTYYALDDEARTILAGRLGFGSISGANLEYIPANIRCFAGGGGSVRGFAYRTLGPRGPFDLPIGGRSLLEASFEARFKVTDTIGVVPFFDAGTAFDGSLPGFKKRIRMAAGIACVTTPAWAPSASTSPSRSTASKATPSARSPSTSAWDKPSDVFSRFLPASPEPSVHRRGSARGPRLPHCPRHRHPSWHRRGREDGAGQPPVQDAIDAQFPRRHRGGGRRTLLRRHHPDVTIRDRDGVWLKLDRARLVWRRVALLSGSLEIERLEIGRLEVLRRPVPSPASATAEPDGWLLPELPMKVEIKGFRLGELVLGESLAGQSARLTADGKAKLGAPAEGLDLDLNVRRLDAAGRLAARLLFVPQGGRLEVKASLIEPAGGLLSQGANLPGTPAIKLDLDGRGTLDAWNARFDFDAGESIGAKGGPALAHRHGTPPQPRSRLAHRGAAAQPGRGGLLRHDEAGGRLALL